MKWSMLEARRSEWKTCCGLTHTVDSEGNPVAILTNRFDLSADEIGQIYRERWAIETFFKWMKQLCREERVRKPKMSVYSQGD
jgi:IS4 transposase